MLIGIDALGIEKASGGRTATLNLLRPLFEIDSVNQYIVAVSSYELLLESNHGNVEQWVLPVKNRFFKRAYAQCSFPFKMRQCDVIHFTKNLSLFGPLPPRILTIYDLSMLKFPQLMAKADFIYWNTVQRIALNSVDQIITISNSAAEDIRKFYRVPQEKISVIYPSITPNFKPASVSEISQVRKKYHLEDEFILHVSRIDPIKNLPSLVKAFKKLKQEKIFNGKLVLVGEFYKKTPDTQLIPTILSLGLEKEVLLLGFVPDQDLPALMSAALVKAFPSHNEGFGLVALEAMACGTPVIASRAGGAVGEVVGDGGIVLDRNDPDTLFNALAEVISKPELQEELRQKGFIQAHKFNWCNTAQQTLDLYGKIAKQKKYDRSNH